MMGRIPYKNDGDGAESVGYPQRSKCHKRTAKRVEAVKRKARSEIQTSQWEAVGYCAPQQQADAAEETLTSSSQPHADTIERVDARAMGVDEFRERVERRAKPVILTGLTDHWAAHKQWKLEKLLRGYRNQKFKCGEDDDGYSVKLKLKYYIDYASSTMDDSPLYIFDSNFGDRAKTNKLLKDYDVPPMFRDDLFQHAADRRRPPYRWFVMGPARSGTGIHIDPLGTSAWNALIVGHKKWCLIHPSAPKQLVKPCREEGRPHPDEAITWFHTVYRRVLSPDWPSDRHPAIHAVQRPGEVMFVPSGWWHVVMNLDFSIAVTQNFCSIVNLSKVWPKTVRARSAVSVHWLKALERERPELMPLLNAINEAHGIEPIDTTEPFDSSSSSSSSDDSASESTDGEPEQQQQLTKRLFAQQHLNGTSTSHGGGDYNDEQSSMLAKKRKPSSYSDC